MTRGKAEPAQVPPANSPQEYFARGKAAYDARNYHQAIADYTKAIELDPKYANAHNNRGNANDNKNEIGPRRPTR